MAVIAANVDCPAHEVLTVGSSPNDEVTHDAKGNITFLPTNLLTPARTLFWDFDNQLTGVDTTGDATPDVTYQYDVLHRRVARVQGSADAVYVHAGNQVVAEYRLGGLPSVPQQRYVWGDYIDEPILKQSSGLGGSTLYYHHNQQYSTVALTNTSGEVVERYAYTAYGELLVTDHAGTPRSLTAHANRYTYTGREWDDATKLYHFRARWYEPVLGRFTARDNLYYSVNIYYAYFPVTGLDPSGHDLIDIKEFAPTEKCEDWRPRFGTTLAIPDFDVSIECGTYLCSLGCERLYGKWPRQLEKCQLKCVECEELFNSWTRFDDVWHASAGDWWDRLPDCPCLVNPALIPEDWERDIATYSLLKPAITSYLQVSDIHPGADFCIRSRQLLLYGMSQQCCYRGGKLITSGLGAGTPDSNNPNHEHGDVRPWYCAIFLDGLVGGNVSLAGGGPCVREFLRRRPPNQGEGCAETLE